jgi:hypothetical protein
MTLPAACPPRAHRFVLRTFFQKYKKDKEGISQQACGGGHVHDSDDEVVEMDLRKMALFRADDLLDGPI